MYLVRKIRRLKLILKKNQEYHYIQLLWLLSITFVVNNCASFVFKTSFPKGWITTIVWRPCNKQQKARKLFCYFLQQSISHPSSQLSGASSPPANHHYGNVFLSLLIGWLLGRDVQVSTAQRTLQARLLCGHSSSKNILITYSFPCFSFLFSCSFPFFSLLLSSFLKLLHIIQEITFYFFKNTFKL